MDKLKMETSDMAAENIEKIGALFPSAVTEMRGEDGSIKKGVNFEMRQKTFCCHQQWQRGLQRGRQL